MNINFNPSRGSGTGFQPQTARPGFAEPFKPAYPDYNPNLGKPGISDPFKPAYPGFNPNSPKEPFLNTRPDSILRRNDSLAWNFQGPQVTKTSAEECLKTCGEGGVKEYGHSSSSDGNAGFHGNARTGKGGLGLNGSHDESEICRCYPKNPNQCSASI